MFRRLTSPHVSAGAATIAALRKYCIDLKVPAMGESILEGKVLEWSKQVGDAVEEDEVVVQIESEKQPADIKAPKTGVLTKIVAQEGETVSVGAVVAKMKEGGDGRKTASPAAAAVPVDTPKPTEPAKSTPVAASATPAPPKKAAPSVQVTTGSDPRVKYVKVSPMRQRIADRLKASQNTSAMLTTFNEINMTPLVQLREKYKDEFLKKHGVKLGFMSPFTKAAATALQEVPIVNASWGQGTIDYHDYVDISVAVSTKTGLVVPVLRDVQNMNLADVEKSIETFAKRANENKLTAAEMTGGTFTISNGGTFGSWMGTPIINPPQSAILGMHAIKKKPWVDEKTGEIVVRDIMAVALTYDHRIMDGRDAVTFLVKIKNIIEDPVRLVLDLA